MHCGVRRMFLTEGEKVGEDMGREEEGHSESKSGTEA